MQSPTVAPNRLAASQRMATISAVVSGVFGAVLITWGVSLQAATLTGGGVLSVGRAVMSALLVVGISLSKRHTKTFPDGLYKLENIFAAVAGLIVLVLAYELVKVSVAHLDGTLIFSNDPKYALPFFLASALLGGVLGYFKRRVSRAEGCPSLEADAYFSFADAAALVIIGVALTLDIAGVPRADAIAGLIVACFLAVIGARILYSGLKVLLDASISRDVLSGVRRIAEGDPGIRKVLSVDGRNSGSFVFLHLVVVPVAHDVNVAQNVAADLERRLKAAFQDIDSVDIEFSPPTAGLAAAMLLEHDGSSAAEDFASAQRVAIVEIDDETLTAQPQVVPNPAIAVKRGAGVYLAVFLGRRAVDVLLVRQDIADEDARATLQAYGVEIQVRPSLVGLQDATAELASIAAKRARGA